MPSEPLRASSYPGAMLAGRRGGGRLDVMVRTMSQDDGEKYRSLEVVKGGRYAKRQGRAVEPYTKMRRTEEMELTRDMHLAFVRMTGMLDAPMTEGLKDIRRGRQKPWAHDGKRLIEAMRLGATEEQVLEYARTWERWIRWVFARDHRRRIA